MPSSYVIDRDFKPSAQRRPFLFVAIVVFLALLLGGRYLASTLIDYDWWAELHQTPTWYSLFFYGTCPIALAALLFFGCFLSAYVLGARQAVAGLVPSLIRSPLAKRIALVLLAILSLGVANATIDSWAIVRFFGSLRLPANASEFIDPIFGKPLHFYLFDLPFYDTLLRVFLVAAVVSLLLYWLTANVETLRKRFPEVGSTVSFEFERFSFQDLAGSRLLAILLALFLLGLAVRFFLARYEMMLEDHGSFLTGVDWLADHVTLPLQWLMIAASILAAALVLAGRGKWAVALLLIVPVRYFLPPIVTAVYVRPNELALERPYIQHHIEATRSAFDLTRRVKETGLDARAEVPISYTRHQSTLDNVRLWDWRAFHDTVSQVQPLRPYIYSDTDVDRYTLDGRLRQVLISPRELDIRQLGEARNRWINPHLIYTHGYGIVMAEANRITPDGLPALIIQDAPPVVNTKSLRFTKPEIYFSEISHEPVFVDTKQQEFNYPTESQHPVNTTYSGTGGFDMSIVNRLAATLTYGDPNILITSYLTGKSRIMIHRTVRERLAALAGFVTWDGDPYLVVNNTGRLVWMVDGYLTSDAHPYSHRLEMPDGQVINYIRNSIKATVDAYSGETHLYIFDPSDILVQAYAKLFPNLFLPASSMPDDIRTHARYPETFFSVQAEIYRTYHMREPESFYNRADLWDLARTSAHNGSGDAGFVQPTYVVASLPGEAKAEFLLITPFTPANKNNLIGFMAARCDGGHLGEVVVEQLDKQGIIFGPIQIDARVNQDQTISKDLSLWNQQGSQVLRGQTLVLPIDNSFLFVEPIYIQASQASMPELKKVALAMGNLLAYADTYEQALKQLIQLSGGSGGPGPPLDTSIAPPAVPQPQLPALGPDSSQVVNQVRSHLERYRQLSSQGKWAEAGKELDEIQQLVQK